MFYRYVSINFREIITGRECREMPFRFIALCLKLQNLGAGMITTSELWKYGFFHPKWRYLMITSATQFAMIEIDRAPI